MDGIEPGGKRRGRWSFQEGPKLKGEAGKKIGNVTNKNTGGGLQGI
jgi:hypothetical protein